MKAVSQPTKEQLKYVSTINDEALSENTNPDLEIEYIDISNVDSTGKIHEPITYRFADAPSRARRIVRPGDVIVSTVRTYLQAIASIESPPTNLIVSTGFAVVRPHPDRLHAGFCKYALREPEFLHEVVARSVGVSYPAINASDLGDIPIYVPSLSEQRAIAQYLDDQIAKIDTLITAKQRLLKLLAEKRRALITHAITRGLNPNAPLRHSGTDLLGDIPVHWDLLPLRRLLKLMDYGISESVDVQGKIAVLRMGDVGDGEISYKDVGFVDKVDPGLLLATNDLVFNRTNSLDQVGKVGIFRGNESFPVSFASYLVRLRCNDLAIPEFLNYQLNSQPMLAWARSEALPAIGQANLNPNRYSYMPIPLPPVHEQIRIVEYLNESVKKINQLCTATQQTIELLQERRISVISAAVLGKIYLS